MASSSSSSGAAPASSGPGAGKPPIVLGDKNFDEEYLLGALYQQALEAKGYKVTLKGNIGSSEIIYKALQSGQIQMYPEYTGTLLTAIAGDTKPPTSAQQTYSLAKAFVTSRARETVGWARELLGGNGILLENHVGRFVADSEAIYSYEGTREINTLIVGRAITGLSAFV